MTAPITITHSAKRLWIAVMPCREAVTRHICRWHTSVKAKRTVTRIDTRFNQASALQAHGQLVGADGNQRVAHMQQFEGPARAKAVGAGEHTTGAQHPGDLA